MNEYIKNTATMVLIIIVIITFLLVTLLSGCFGGGDGYEVCKNSYDNLILIDGWKIYDHSSDFVSGAENRYFVSYYIGHPNMTVKTWIRDFIYDSENDILHHSGGASYYVKEIKNP